MGLVANYPFALAPAMGLNAYFTFSVVLGLGISWRVALTAVFVEGLIILVLTLSNIRNQIIMAIPVGNSLNCKVFHWLYPLNPKLLLRWATI